MNAGVKTFHESQASEDREICDLLYAVISRNLLEAENKVWHAHPVWFLEGNPIVGYSKLKDGVRLFFWSGASFEEEALKPGTGKFKDASICYTSAREINQQDLDRWLEKARRIQWDYKNLVKRKGVLKWKETDRKELP